MTNRPHWRPIETAEPVVNEPVWVYVAARDGLPAFQTHCAYHPDAGWCVDELREVTHWAPLEEVWLPPPAREDPWEQVAAVAREIAFVGSTVASDPSLKATTARCAAWAGRLQKAIKDER